MNERKHNEPRHHLSQNLKAPTDTILVSKAEVEKVREALEYYVSQFGWNYHGNPAKKALTLPFLQNLRGREGK